MSLRIVVLLLSTFVSACSQTSMSVDPVQVATVMPPQADRFYVGISGADQLKFIGQINSGVEGSSRQMAYPGDNAAVFLASIAAHAFLESSFQKERRQEMIEQSNLALKPYRPIIDSLSQNNVLDAALSLLNQESSFDFLSMNETLSGNNWLIFVEPTYIMSKDQKSIVVESKFAILASSDYLAEPDRFFEEVHHQKNERSERRATLTRREKDVYQSYAAAASENQKVIADQYHYKVVTISPLPLPDPALWQQDNGLRFKRTVDILLAESIKIATDDFLASSSTQNKLKTIKYLENGKKKVERGRLLDKSCGFIVFETLRKDIKVVPELNWTGGCASHEGNLALLAQTGS